MTGGVKWGCGGLYRRVVKKSALRPADPNQFKEATTMLQVTFQTKVREQFHCMNVCVCVCAGVRRDNC